MWDQQPVADPTPGDALVAVRALRREGDMNARRLADDIEAAAHAAH